MEDALIAMTIARVMKPCAHRRFCFDGNRFPHFRLPLFATPLLGILAEQPAQNAWKLQTGGPFRGWTQRSSCRKVTAGFLA
jgi:hypothetical protein